jgi:hypothetical protein
MRVQDLLLTALFLEDITEPLVVIQRRFYTFKGMAQSKRTRLRLQSDIGLDLRFVELCHFLASRLRRCLQGITLLQKGIGLAREIALCCRKRRKKSGHASRSVLRTG